VIKTLVHRVISIVPAPVRALSISGIGAALGLVSEMIISNSLTAPDYALFRYSYSLVIIASSFALFGASQAITRAVATQEVTELAGDDAASAFLLSFTCTLLTISSIAILAVMGILEISGPVLLGIVSLWIILRVTFQMYRSVAIGRGKYLSAQLSDRIALNAIPILVLAPALWTSTPLTPIVALCAFLLSSALSLLIAKLSVGEYGVFRRMRLLNLRSIKLRFKSSAQLAVGDGADAFIRMGVVIVAAVNLDLTEVAVLALAIRLTEALGLISSAASAVYSRAIAIEISSHDNAGVRPNSMMRHSLFCCLFVSICWIICLLYGDEITTAFGVNYDLDVNPLVITTMALLIKSALGPWNLALFFLGRGATYCLISIIFSAVLVTSTLVLSDAFGLAGALASYSTSLVLQSAAGAFYVRRVSGARPGLLI